MKIYICIFLMVLINIRNAKVDGQENIISDPILILATNYNFGLYTEEILKAEGFNEFQIHSASDKKINLTYLKKFDVVILAESILTAKQQTMFARYVKEGGNLIAFKPDKKLSDVFGIEYTGGTIDEAYILINTNTEIGKGLTLQSLQFHGSADKYIVKAGKIIADLYKNAVTSKYHMTLL